MLKIFKNWRDSIMEDQLKTIKRLNKECQEKSNLMFQAIQELEYRKQGIEDPKYFRYILCGMLNSVYDNETIQGKSELSMKEKVEAETLKKVLDKYDLYYGIK